MKRLASRPKTAKLAKNAQLRELVQTKLLEKLSPEQISRELRQQFPDDAEMQVSHETIYQSIYVQGRGALRRELAVCLRTGRALRRPRRKSQERRGRIPNMINISERPAEVEDRAVPGHWEGDLIIGKGHQSAVATLAERASRFCLIVALPDGRTADKVADALADRILTLPAALRRTLTWDRGIEMAAHATFTLASGMPVYVADPHSPWQRGTNENTNGLIRYYLPKGTDLSGYAQGQLDAIADKLNARPRRTLSYRTPAEALNDLLVATTT
jgi:IS30 family transposase